MGNQDDSGSSLPRYGWSGTTQQFAVGGKARMPTRDIYKNAAIVGAGVAAVVLIHPTPITTSGPGWNWYTNPDNYKPKTSNNQNSNITNTPVAPSSDAGTASTGNTVDLYNDMTPEKMSQLLLEDIGGTELITLVRHEQINGISQGYTPIRNLADLSLEYNPLAISANPNNVTDLLSTYPLSISKYIPTQEELNDFYPSEDGVVSEAIAAKRKVVYFDKDLNSLFVHVKNIYLQENIEVEFFIPDEVKDGTIYT
jgi:hypothetical protein